MKGKRWAVTLIIFLVMAALIGALIVFVHDPVLIRPSGLIAAQQRDLLYFATGVMLAVALPVFVLTAYIARKYRATNRRARYTPNEDGNRSLELVWWGIPIAIVGLLSVVAWRTSHSLDPFRPLDDTAPYRVQVIALEWKWLFIYPDYKTASVNELAIPVGQPVEFSIASDAPMNSFWIPELGGQIYAMSGMSTQLHLQANKPGVFRGVSSNLSGDGFSDMKFDVRAMPTSDLAQWQYDATTSPLRLAIDNYPVLAMPATVSSPLRYRLDTPDLYQMVIDKYSLDHSRVEDNVHMKHEGAI